MAEVGHAVQVEEIRRGIVNTSFANFLNCTIPAAQLEDSTEYMVIVSALIQGASPDRDDFYFRLYDGSTVLLDSECRLEPRDTSTLKGEQYFYMRRYTTPATAVDVRFQGHTDAVAISVRSVSFYAVAIKLADLAAGDFADAENLTNLTSLDNTGWTEGTSITIGDGASDWLVFGCCHTLVDNVNTNIRMRITDDGVQVGEFWELEGENTVEERCQGFMWALPALESSDIALEFQTDNATAGFMDISRSQLFALRLNAFEDHLIAHDPTDTGMTVADTDYGTISVTHKVDSGGQARDWAVFGGSIISTGDNAKTIRHHIRDGATRLVGDSTDITDGLMQMHAGAADKIPNLRFGEYASVAHGSTVVANIKNQENNDVAPVPSILDAHMGWFTWELAKPHLPYFNKRHNTLLRM